MKNSIKMFVVAVLAMVSSMVTAQSYCEQYVDGNTKATCYSREAFGQRALAKNQAEVVKSDPDVPKNIRDQVMGNWKLNDDSIKDRCRGDGRCQYLNYTEVLKQYKDISWQAQRVREKRDGTFEEKARRAWLKQDQPKPNPNRKNPYEAPRDDYEENGKKLREMAKPYDDEVGS